MTWDVLFHDAFDAEFEEFPEDVREELLARAGMLQEFAHPSDDRLWIP